jgi:type II secretory ATPase GspE/PulE/Tfp pilus assembly ATPase PilB-like protein
VKELARSRMTSMRDDGWAKICSGITSFEEVLRTTQRDDADVPQIGA